MDYAEHAQDVEVLYLNNVLSIPVLAVFSLLVEDWSSSSLERNLFVFPSDVLLKLSVCTAHRRGGPSS